MKTSKITTFIVAIVVMMISVLSFVLYRQHTEPYRIHYVNYRGKTDIDAGFEHYLKSKHIRYDIVYHDVDRNPLNFPKIVQSINADKTTDLVVTFGTTTTLAIFGSINDVRTSDKFVTGYHGVFVLVTNPSASQIVPLNKNDRDLTGSWHVAPIENQFRSMMAFKTTKTICVLYTPTENNSVVTLSVLKELASRHQVQILSAAFNVQNGVPNSSNAVDAIEDFKDKGCEWLYLPPDTFLGSQVRDLVIPTAHKHGLMTFASTEQIMNAGAAFGLISKYFELGVLTAEKAEQILVQNVLPSSIPIDTVERFHLQMNSTVLKSLKILPPKEVIGIAEDIAN